MPTLVRRQNASSLTLVHQTPAVLVTLVSKNELTISGDWTSELIDGTLKAGIGLSWTAYGLWMLYFGKLRYTVLKDAVLLLATLTDGKPAHADHLL